MKTAMLTLAIIAAAAVCWPPLAKWWHEVMEGINSAGGIEDCEWDLDELAKMVKK